MSFVGPLGVQTMTLCHMMLNMPLVGDADSTQLVSCTIVFISVYQLITEILEWFSHSVFKYVNSQGEILTETCKKKRFESGAWFEIVLHHSIIMQQLCAKIMILPII